MVTTLPGHSPLNGALPKVCVHFAGVILVAAMLLLSAASSAQTSPKKFTAGAMNYLSITLEGVQARMAYLDEKPARPNGSTVLLLHGKNFNSYYWKDVTYFLREAGFRVIVPDQLGFGKSDKPNIHYTFHLLAANTKKLLDTLGITEVTVICHSIGGMLGTRFALMYPAAVKKLIYENPIGLEDYRTFVPYQPVDRQFEQEKKSDYASLKKYQQSYYPEWKDEYEQYVSAQLDAFHIPDLQTAAWASALTYDMIYQQPVLYEFTKIKAPVLMIIGQADRTIVGKALLAPEIASAHGNYPQLGRAFHEAVSGSVLKELPGVGHIPHIQVPQEFKKLVLDFLR